MRETNTLGLIRMRRKAIVLKTALGLLAIVLALQMINVAAANPFSFGPTVKSFPSATVATPVENQSYPSDNVWFNLTITKPADWLGIQYQGHITSVTYRVDPAIDDHFWGDNEMKATVQDPLGVVNPAANISLSITLEGLHPGKHTLEAVVEGSTNHTGISFSVKRVNFTVFEAETNSTPTNSTSIPTIELSIVSGALAIGIIVGICLIYSQKKS